MGFFLQYFSRLLQLTYLFISVELLFHLQNSASPHACLVFFLHMHGNFGLCPDHCGSFCMHICRCLPVNECLTTFGLRAHCLTLQQTASLFLLRRELCVFIQLLDVWVM